MEITRNLRHNLHYLKSKNDLTQEELGKKLGKKRSTIGKYLTDPSIMQLATLFKVAKVFRCGVFELLETEMGEARVSDKPEQKKPEPPAMVWNSAIHRDKFKTQWAKRCYMLALLTMKREGIATVKEFGDSLELFTGSGMHNMAAGAQDITPGLQWSLKKKYPFVNLNYIYDEGAHPFIDSDLMPSRADELRKVLKDFIKD